MMASARRRVLIAQSVYCAVTGVWPLVHLSSFELITGPKTEDWLVHMVGLLALVTGVAIGVPVAQGRVHTPDITTLAAGAAIAFAAIVLWYSLSGRIAPIYLADAAFEGVLLAGLAATRSRQPPTLGVSSS